MDHLSFSKRFKFSEWPNPEVPSVAAGVYAIWRDETLVYIGMSGRGITDTTHQTRKEYGLVTRLRSHASGRLSGDQFCVYIANRFVIPKLTDYDRPRFESGEDTLDRMTKIFIHDHLDYNFALVPTASDAHKFEKNGRLGLIFAQKPFLNPL